MANQKSTQAAPAAPVNDSAKIVFSADRCFSLAISALDEIVEEQNDVFCLACAGERSGTEYADVEHGVFRAIQRVTMCVELSNALRQHIKNLAQHAGVAVEVQS